MLYIVLAVFLLLGLGTFFVAIRGGPRGARQALHTESTIGQRLVTLGIVVVFAFGLVVPALVLAFNGEHKASVAIGGVHLNGEEQKGRELFAHACTVCHTLAAVSPSGASAPTWTSASAMTSRPPPGASRSSRTRSWKAARAASDRCRRCCTRARKRKTSPSFVAAVAGH